MKYELDEWQEEVMNTKGNLCLRSGRQVGKSFVIAIKAAEYAVKHRNKTVMIVASVERQAYLLFEKVVAYMLDKHKYKIKMGKDRPTKNKMNLLNGSRIYCLPTGMTGAGIRGFTIDLFIADEAAFIPEEVFVAVIPALAVTKGDIWLLSTPHGRQGFYYDCFQREDFTTFHVSSLDCPRKDDEFLEREKARMTKVQFAQEYLGEFVDELMQLFPTPLINKCMTLSPTGFIPSSSRGERFLGVDVARMGGDETVLISLERYRDRCRMIEMDVNEEARLTETAKRILYSDKKHNYRNIYIDDGGLGAGVFDMLLLDEQTRRKVEAINNSSRPLVHDERRKKKLLKEDLYVNLLRLMEKGNIDLFDDENVLLSLKSVQYEYTDDKQIKIFSKYGHIAEALIRAAWCMRSKTLSIWVA